MSKTARGGSEGFERQLRRATPTLYARRHDEEKQKETYGAKPPKKWAACPVRLWGASPLLYAPASYPVGVVSTYRLRVRAHRVLEKNKYRLHE